jgi:hypothetical protein
VEVEPVVPPPPRVADAVASFEDERVEAAPAQLARRPQAGRAAADHDDLHGVEPR